MAVSFLPVTLLVFTSLLSLGQIAQAATFSFSTGSLPISEGRNLSEMLSIIKTGDNVNTITFRVTVTSGTAEENTDYIPNSDYNYVFTSDTRSLPIQTQLVADRAGEGIEDFTICLPTQLPGAMVTSPNCVVVTIIDDDSVVIGFQDGSTSVSITEGDPPQMICAEVKDFGLELDPFDSVPLNLRTDPAESGVMLGTDTFTFRAANIVRCTTVSFADNNEVDGTRTIQVILAEQTPTTTTVPTELYPVSSQVTISDDETAEIGFRFNAQSSYAIEEGIILRDIHIEKYGSDTSLNFNVTPTVEPMDLEELRVMGAYFAPSISRQNIVVEAPNNSVTGEPKLFNLAIDESRIYADNGIDTIGGFRVSTGGNQIQITVYDNDLKIGFTRRRFEVTENSMTNVGVKIFAPQEIHPSASRSIQISVNYTMLPTGRLSLEKSDIIFDATTQMATLYVNYSTAGNGRCTNGEIATLQLSWTNDNVTFLQNITTIALKCTSSALSAGARAALGIVISIVIIAITVILVAVILYYAIFKRKSQPAEISYQMNDDRRSVEDGESPSPEVEVSPPAGVVGSPPAEKGESPPAEVEVSPSAGVVGSLPAENGESPTAEVEVSPPAGVVGTPPAENGESPPAEVEESPADRVVESPTDKVVESPPKEGESPPKGGETPPKGGERPQEWISLRMEEQKRHHDGKGGREHGEGERERRGEVKTHHDGERKRHRHGERERHHGREGERHRDGDRKRHHDGERERNRGEERDRHHIGYLEGDRDRGREHKKHHGGERESHRGGKKESHGGEDSTGTNVDGIQSPSDII